MPPLLTVDQARLLRDTKVATRDGHPLVLHHGTMHRFDRFERTRDLGFHFGTREQAARRLETLTPAERKAAGGGQPRVVSVALAANAPLLLPDDPMTWQPGHMAEIFERFLGQDETAALHDPGIPHESKPAIVRAALVRAGHDCVVYRNQVESASRSRGVEWSWLVLDPAVIVHLGEDVAADVALLPDGMTGTPGMDPDAELRAIGGLRRLNGSLASVKEMRVFRNAATSVVEAALGTLPFRDSTMFRAYRQAEASVGDARIRIEVHGDAGRVRVYVQPVDVKALQAAGRTDQSIRWEFKESHGFVAGLAHLADRPGFKFDRTVSSLMPTMFYQASWQPGEPMQAAMARLETAVNGTVEALRAMAEPEPAMAGP